jgi:hypothetical protein
MRANLTTVTSEHLSFPADRLKRMSFTGAPPNILPSARPIGAGDEAIDLPMTGNFSSYSLPPLLLEIGDEWGHQTNLAEVRNIILNHSSGYFSALGSLASMFSIRPEMEWSIMTRLLEVTENEIFPACNKLSEETMEFIEQRRLREGVAWLKIATPYFFPGTDFEIELLPAEDGEENMLALRIYGSLSVSEFRERRHAMCKAMTEADHRRLYEIISIFQRRTRNDGWQAVSWYSSLSAE